jgi:hypothetical protein
MRLNKNSCEPSQKCSKNLELTEKGFKILNWIDTHLKGQSESLIRGEKLTFNDSAYHCELCFHLDKHNKPLNENVKIRCFDLTNNFIKHILEHYNFETLKSNLCSTDRFLINDSNLIIDHIKKDHKNIDTVNKLFEFKESSINNERQLSFIKENFLISNIKLVEKKVQQIFDD